MTLSFTRRIHFQEERLGEMATACLPGEAHYTEENHTFLETMLLLTAIITDQPVGKTLGLTNLNLAVVGSLVLIS